MVLASLVKKVFMTLVSGIDENSLNWTVLYFLLLHPNYVFKIHMESL